MPGPRTPFKTTEIPAAARQQPSSSTSLDSNSRPSFIIPVMLLFFPFSSFHALSAAVKSLLSELISLNAEGCESVVGAAILFVVGRTFSSDCVTLSPFRLWLRGKVPRLQPAAPPRPAQTYPYKVNTHTHTLDL